MTTEEMAAAIAETDSRCRSNTHRLDKMEERQDNLDKLVSAVSGLQKDMEYTTKDVGEIKTDVKTLMDGPRNRWNAIVNTIITGIVGVLIGAVMALVIK